MEYKIKNTNGYYFPRTERWIMDTFNLNLIESVIYQLILNKGFITWTPEWLGEVCKCSRRTVIRVLDKFIDREIMTKRTFNVSEDGVRLRTVYVALYEKTGKRDMNVVQSLLETGYKKIMLEYTDKKTYNKKKL